MVISSDPASGVSVQYTIYRLLEERPEWRRYLQDIAAWELENPPSPIRLGWEWYDVNVPTPAITKMVGENIVRVVSGSRAHRYCRLKYLESTRAALEMGDPGQMTFAPVDVDSLFHLVVGHERAKALIRYAIKADRPVHCLLVGPPGTAKTLMLGDIGNLPGAEFYVGSTTTKAGLVGLLLSVKPRYLVIDELDKMETADMSPLLNLMETGQVTLLQHKTQAKVTLQTKVFAGANETKNIKAPILSRFAQFHIPPYNPREFVDVATQVLIQSENQGPEMAQHIATEVVKYSTDIRDAVRVARMARKHPTRVVEIVACLWPERAPRPIRPVS